MRSAGWLVYAFMWWAVLFGFYLLLAAKQAVAEAVAGVAIAALGAAAATSTAGAGKLRFRARLPWLAQVARLPGRILADCGIVAVALWRRLVGRHVVSGEFRIVPFDPGGDDAESAARRALVTLGVTLAPNTYVVAVDRERGVLLLHQLVPSAQPPGGGDREWPL